MAPLGTPLAHLKYTNACSVMSAEGAATLRRDLWTTTRLVPRRRRPERDPFPRATRRCGADLAERLLRRWRVRARDRAAYADPGAGRPGEPAGPGGAANRRGPAAVHRCDAARRHAREPGYRCVGRAGVGARVRPISRDR